MKKVCILLILMSFILPISHAQEPEFGVKIGFHNSTIDGDSADEFDFRAGPAFAVFSKFKISDKLSFQPELQYGAYGANHSDGDADIDQLTIPLKFNYFTGANGNNDGFKINLGPQVGFTVGDKIRGGEEDIDLSDTIQDNGGTYEEVDLGATLNLGYEFPFGLWLETGAYHSVLPIWELEGGEKNYNSVGTFTIGFNFDRLND